MLGGSRCRTRCSNTSAVLNSIYDCLARRLRDVRLHAVMQPCSVTFCPFPLLRLPSDTSRGAVCLPRSCPLLNPKPGTVTPGRTTGPSVNCRTQRSNWTALRFGLGFRVAATSDADASGMPPFIWTDLALLTLLAGIRHKGN